MSLYFTTFNKSQLIFLNLQKNSNEKNTYQTQTHKHCEKLKQIFPLQKTQIFSIYID